MFLNLSMCCMSLFILPAMSMLAKSFLIFWVILEVQLFFFLILLMIKKSKVAQVYFCMSGFSSIWLLAGAFFSLDILVVLSLLIKLSSVPFPFWAPWLVGLEWQINQANFYLKGGVLLMFSKMLPLIGMSKYCFLNYQYGGIIILNMIFSAFGIMSSANMGELLGWSGSSMISIWAMISLKDPLALGGWFALYSVLVLVTLGYKTKPFLSGLLLILMGVPPFFMFLIKAHFFLMVAESFGQQLGVLFIGGFILQIFGYAYWLVKFVMLK